MIEFRRLTAALCTAMPLTLAPLAAQSPAPTYPPEFAEPMPPYARGLGPYGWRVTTASTEAQAYFNQGVQLMFAFAKDDAARSFREAWRRDSTCAMCYWGEAWAWGPYLNGGMAAADPPRATLAATEAARLAPGHSTPRERALIEAMATRYVAKQDSALRVHLDSTYAGAMARVWERFPGDAEVGTLYAESLMLLEPRRGYWSLQKPSIALIHAVLEQVLAGDLVHPGACHLYIHATESSEHPEKAEACAAHLGHAIPGASHLNHMPSHTYNRVGRWGDAVEANLSAWHSDQAAEDNEGFAIYPAHNLHMLLFAASFDGQGAVADQAARDYARVTRKPSDAGPSSGGFYEALVLLRFGRFEEVLALQGPAGSPIGRGLWTFARGYACLRQQQIDSAWANLAAVDSLARVTPDSVTFRGHTARELLGITGGILRAELLRNEGRIDSAVPILERAAALEDAMTYDEPEPLNFSARHWLGAALLEARRAGDAERVYRAELTDHPHNGWSLLGLSQALRAQGKTREAAVAEAEFEDAWKRSDTRLRASRF